MFKINLNEYKIISKSFLVEKSSDILLIFFPALKSIIPTTLPQKVFDPCDAVLLKPDDPALIRSDGVVSLDYIYAYPPGIPFVVPGELISREMLEAFSSLSKLGVIISNYERYSRILKSLP